MVREAMIVDEGSVADLGRFLLARLDDEAAGAARDTVASVNGDRDAIVAKRRVVAEALQHARATGGRPVDAAIRELSLDLLYGMAWSYHDHRDFRPEWSMLR